MAATDSDVSRGSGADRQSPPNRRQQPPRRRAAVRRRRAPAEPRPASDPEAAATGSRGGWPRGLAAMPFAVSMILHAVVMLVMALVFTISAIRQEPPLPITASLAGDEPIENMEPLEIESLPDQEFDEPALDAVVDPGEIAIGDVMVAGDAVADVSEIAADPAGDLGSLDGLDLGTGLGGEGDGAGGYAGITFFGAKSTGRSFVFVVDNSNSMTRGRFETALAELVRAVGALGPKQRFSVIFYSDTAYGLFHPQANPGLVPATEANKEKLRAWLYTVEMCLNTRGEQAMQKALAMNPDVVNVLGDGAFTDQTVPLLTARHSRRTVVNTFGMQVDPKGEAQLAAIAGANRGKFHRVDVEPAAVRAAQANPIRRNTTRGPVWGLKLPQK